MLTASGTALRAVRTASQCIINHHCHTTKMQMCQPCLPEENMGLGNNLSLVHRKGESRNWARPATPKPVLYTARPPRPSVCGEVLRKTVTTTDGVWASELSLRKHRSSRFFSSSWNYVNIGGCCYYLCIILNVYWNSSSHSVQAATTLYVGIK